MTKIQLEDLEKAIKWIKANTGESFLTIIETNDGIELRTFDKEHLSATITLYKDGSLFPQVKKSERL